VTDDRSSGPSASVTDSVATSLTTCDSAIFRSGGHNCYSDRRNGGDRNRAGATGARAVCTEPTGYHAIKFLSPERRAVPSSTGDGAVLVHWPWPPKPPSDRRSSSAAKVFVKANNGADVKRYMADYPSSALLLPQPGRAHAVVDQV
jgi:hypothetical protein